MSENEKFFLALIAPLGITVMGLLLGIGEMFIGGLVFTCLILITRWLRSRT